MPDRMVGMSPGFGRETEKLQFSDNSGCFSNYCWSNCVQVAPGGVELRPRRFQELRGSLELQNGRLRVLAEAWMMVFRLKHFLSSLVVFRSSVGGLASSRTSLGAVGKVSTPEMWPESTWGCMESRLHISLSRLPGFGYIRFSRKTKKLTPKSV